MPIPSGAIDDCPICRHPPPEVPARLAAELPSLWVTVPELTPLPGYVCLVAKRHVVEPFELPPDERRRFWRDVDLVSELLWRSLKPAKLNYEIHGNTIRHLHLHLFPRTAGDRFEGRPIDGRDGLPRTDDDRARLRDAFAALPAAPAAEEWRPVDTGRR